MLIVGLVELGWLTRSSNVGLHKRQMLNESTVCALDCSYLSPLFFALVSIFLKPCLSNRNKKQRLSLSLYVLFRFLLNSVLQNIK